MRYNIISQGVRARQCRAPTGVPHVNENRYNAKIWMQEFGILSRFQIILTNDSQLILNPYESINSFWR
ncbi:hypothetical protein [Nostoc sphaeroides]|uniref:hypothetical protein n=1 Tax=Nostoc sphaeroides TaxID=446679 RepID=UPI001269F3E7|nr:hypothetical protein [Nostoc sphaeroides]